MRTNYNDSSRNGGRFQKRQNSNGKNGGNGGNNGGRRPQHGRRPGQGGSSINAASATAARNKYLELAKEALSNGNRVEAENYYQHAEHYSKILNAAMENRREREEHHDSSNGHRRHNNHHNGENHQPDTAAETGNSAPAAASESVQNEPQASAAQE